MGHRQHNIMISHTKYTRGSYGCYCNLIIFIKRSWEHTTERLVNNSTIFWEPDPTPQLRTAFHRKVYLKLEVFLRHIIKAYNYIYILSQIQEGMYIMKNIHTLDEVSVFVIYLVILYTNIHDLLFLYIFSFIISETEQTTSCLIIVIKMVHKVILYIELQATEAAAVHKITVLNC